jgi:dihydroorotate dehydrogenase electron transfer subunit
LKQELAPVIANNEVMPGVHLIWLDSPRIASDARPGQFVMVRCGPEYLLRRPLSIHQLADTRLALLFTVVGKGTHWLSQCQIGDTIDTLGPLGNGFSINPDSQKLLLVAGGIGIAPLYSLASSASKEGYSIRILLGASTAIQLYLKEYQYQSIKAEFALATEDGTAGERGVITNLIPRYVDWADQIFACGPLPMYKAMAQMPELKGKAVQISLEVRMGCGRGICYGCTVKTKRGLKQVCQDGPIFELDDILWDELNY